MEKLKKCIFRGKDSGVFYGEEFKIEGQKATIKNSRNIFYWDGATRLEQLATDGTKNPNNCKFTQAVNIMEIYDLIQKIPCTDEAIKSIEGVKEWKI